MPEVPTASVFVSSTWLDLQPEREAVEAVVQRLRETKFVGMEYFGSRDETTRRASLDEVDRSNVYVGIIGARYGSGITEDEYRRARRRGLRCFVYFKADPVSLPPDLQEDAAATAARLRNFKDELQRAHTVATFVNPDNLAAKVTADLHNWLFNEYLTPLLERAARGETSLAQAQAILLGVRDTSALSPSLLAQLTARYQLRAPVGDFVGREKEIAGLTETLRGGGSAAISGISGMGGIGKTELALYVADKLRDAYPDAQLVVDMRGTDNPPREHADALAACIRAFVGLEQRLPDDAEELTQLYRTVLEGKRALILLDNASDSAQTRPLLPPAGSALLITSRNAITLPHMTRVTLDQLHPSEARELLTGIAPRIPPDIADQICHLCGYLPLALRAAGSLLDITLDLDPADYARQLGDERTRLQHIGTEGVDLDVEASISLSYNRLAPDAARVFRLLSVFPATFDAPAEEAICEDPDHQHLSDLLRRNLVLYNPDTRRYRLHDLVRLFASARTTEDERSAAQARHAEHYLGVLDLTDELYQRGGEAVKRGLALFDLEWRNIQAGHSWAEKQSGENDAAASLCMNYPAAGAHSLDLRRHPRERIRWLETALAAARRLKNRGLEGVHLGNLGIAYRNLGEVRRAVEFYEQHLAVAREIGDRRGESNALGNLGNAYADLGEVPRAVEFHEQQLAIVREIGDRRGEGTALGNLGLTYADLGEVRRAVEFYEQQLAIVREIGDRRGEGNALGNLGNAYANLGEVRRAVEFYEQGLAVAREIGDRRGEGIALFNTALALNRLGDRAQAIAHAEAAFEIFEQIESPHAGTVRAKIAEWRGQG